MTTKHTAPIAGPVADQPCPVCTKTHKSGSKPLNVCIQTFNARQAATPEPVAPVASKPARKSRKQASAPVATEHAHQWAPVIDATTGEVIPDMECIVAACATVRPMTDEEMTEHMPADSEPESGESKTLPGSAPGEVPTPKPAATNGTKHKSDVSWVPEVVANANVTAMLLRANARDNNYVQNAINLATDMYTAIMSGKWATYMEDGKGGTSVRVFPELADFCTKMNVRAAFSVRDAAGKVSAIKNGLISKLWSATDSAGTLILSVEEIGQAVGMNRSSVSQRAKSLGLTRYVKNASGENVADPDSVVTPPGQSKSGNGKPETFTRDALRAMSAKDLVILLGAEKAHELAKFRAALTAGETSEPEPVAPVSEPEPVAPVATKPARKPRKQAATVAPVSEPVAPVAPVSEPEPEPEPVAPVSEPVAPVSEPEPAAVVTPVAGASRAQRRALGRLFAGARS